MSKFILYYKSKYGSTKKYAEYISSKLGCEMKDAFLATDEEIEEYDTIIFGGGVYASAIIGSNFLNNHENVLKNKRIIVFAVGLTEYDEYNSSKSLFRKNIPNALLNKIFTFNLFGALDYKKLKFMEKILVKSMIGSIKSKATYLKTQTDEKILKSGKKGIDLVDFSHCEAIIECALDENYNKKIDDHETDD